ncbi:transposase [Pseudosulfitobacter pseudonitzschiae]|uniref:transposase n=1 Tax=Pseudosulfitobacter pseudonitzschiae TaxID=1402135 RepID=UPI0032E90AE7
MATVLRSIMRIGPVASLILIAEMPMIGTISGEEAAALTGLTSGAHVSGTHRAKRAIAGGRRAMRHLMFRAALVAAHHNPSLISFARPENRTRSLSWRREKARHHRERPVQNRRKWTDPTV